MSEFHDCEPAQGALYLPLLAGSLPLIMPTPHAGFEHAVKLSRIQSKFDLTPYEAVAGQPTMSRRKTP